jgi:hypothetical protein
MPLESVSTVACSFEFDAVFTSALSPLAGVVAGWLAALVLVFELFELLPQAASRMLAANAGIRNFADVGTVVSPFAAGPLGGSAIVKMPHRADFFPAHRGRASGYDRRVATDVPGRRVRLTALAHTHAPARRRGRPFGALSPRGARRLRRWLLLGALAPGAFAAMAPAAVATHRVKPRRAKPPAGDCQPYGAAPCLLPFPDNRFTQPDPTTATGVRVHLPPAAMPVNRIGEAMSVAEYDRNDGFSPGSTVVVHVPGLDNGKAFENTAPAGLADIARAFVPQQPIVILDEQTAARQLVWSELDYTAISAPTTDLLIHPGSSFIEGHTYVVALRNLRDRRGRLIAAPEWFARLRDRRRVPPAERPLAGRYARIFATLRRARIARAGLYEAWDFTVASTISLTSRLLAIRDDAFAQLGDSALADGRVQGQAPAFAVTSSDQLTPRLRRVQGTFEVPCYLIACGASATSGFHYGSAEPNALPAQIPGNLATAAFECIVPSTATSEDPARLVLYGHGFLGSHAEVEARWVQELAGEYNIAFCATDWWGLAAADLPFLVQALRNVNELPSVVDRLQQGVLNTLYLGRLMLNAQGLASDGAFQSHGRAVIETSRLYFYGNSLGGILGGVTTAVAPDFSRAVLGVTGSDFFNLMVPRGTVFARFGKFVTRNYRDHSLHPLILDLLQQLWDRGDPDGYAQQMSARPLPDTPPHVVLMQVAYGDFQVSTFAAAVEARTIGASAHEPALDSGDDRLRDRELLLGLPAIPSYPFGGSAIVLWDSGPGRTQPPPLVNLPPVASAGDQDPHEDPRYTPAAQSQISDFLAPGGAVVDTCGEQPCHTSTYVP